MAESQLKRQREESYDVQVYECEEGSKRHKSYNDILSILEQEDEPNQDLSDIFTSLQQELSSDSTTTLDPLPSGGSSEAESSHNQAGGPGVLECSSATSSNNEDHEEDERVRVMRHLLEASDDELGIPNRVESGGEDESTSEEGEQQLFPLGDWKWQFEDDAANYYYSMMQSELFM